MHMKKIISILLAVMILTSMTTVALAAKEQKTKATFTGKLSISGPSAPLQPGTNTKLKATVKKANLKYAIAWQRYDTAKKQWIKVGKGEEYKFSAPAAAGTYTYRAYLKAKDGTVLKQKYKVVVAEPEPAEDTAPAEEPVTENTAPAEETAPAKEGAPAKEETPAKEEAPAKE